MPQDQNSGGFYLALFRKNGDFDLPEVEDPVKDSSEEFEVIDEPLDEEISELPSGQIEVEPELELEQNKQIIKTIKNAFTEAIPKKKEKINSYQTRQEAAFIPLPVEIWADLKKEFEIDDKFPSNLLYVQSDKCKAIYLVTQKIADYLKNDAKSAIKMIIYGTVLFQRSRAEANTPNNYRISQSGIQFLRPFMHKNIINVTFEELSYFVRCKGSVSCEEMLNEKSIDAIKFTKLPKNSYCLVYKSSGDSDDEELFMVSKMEHSICIMVPKEDVAGCKIKYSIE